MKIATLAQDNAYGREGIAAFKAGAKKLGANIVNEQYADKIRLTSQLIFKISLAQNQIIYLSFGQGRIHLGNS